MGFLGLVPSEYSTGQTRRQGEITKCGNSHARRVLVESCLELSLSGAQSVVFCRSARRDSPKAVREIAWRAQLRLAHRYRRLTARKLHQNKICVAIARELRGCLGYRTPSDAPLCELIIKHPPTTQHGESQLPQPSTNFPLTSGGATRCAGADEGNPSIRLRGHRTR